MPDDDAADDVITAGPGTPRRPPWPGGVLRLVLLAETAVPAVAVTAAVHYRVQARAPHPAHVPAASVTASLPLPEMTTVALALPADGRVTGTVYDLDGNDCSTTSPLTDHVWATGATSAAGAADLVGWAMWFGNRQEGLRDRWLRLRTSRHYRGCPQP